MKRRDLTGGERLKALLLSGKPIGGGTWIDTYNQSVDACKAGTLKARTDSNCMYFVSVYEET